MYERGGYAARAEDPAALAVKGRLLKARARRLSGSQRAALMGQAGECYAAADSISPAPYLAINAASLALQAGDREAATARAQSALDRLALADDLTDTPYYLAATRAEALLLLGDKDGAEAALRAAVGHDPDGWSDRAATIGQLDEILAASGQDAAWLDQYRPPLSLHFAGHMGIASGGDAERRLATELERAFAELCPGFAWGALAAGADLVIAEMLLDRGCFVHAVLPCPVEAFAQQSVAPAGDAWLQRFRAVLPRCASVRIAGPQAASVHDPVATAFAGELAIGAALRNSNRFNSRCAQLIVADQSGGGANTARQARMWSAASGQQINLTATRDLSVEAIFPPEQPDPARRLAFLIFCNFDALIDDVDRDSARIAELTGPISAALSRLPSGAVRAGPGWWEIALEDSGLGIAALSSLLALCRDAALAPSIGAHLAICNLLSDQASGATVAYGPAPALARRLSELAAPGTVLASEELAVCLTAREITALQPEPYLPDEQELGGTAYLINAA